MPVFPVFIEMKNRKVLVVGGGNVALRKIRTLSDFEADILVLSREIDPRISEIKGVSTQVGEYSRESLLGMDMVIAATDNPELNRQIASDCKDAGIMVNTASGRAENSFFFPAIARNEEYIIGISTDGRSPRASSEMRKRIQREIFGEENEG